MAIWPTAEQMRAAKEKRAIKEANAKGQIGSNFHKPDPQVEPETAAKSASRDNKKVKQPRG